MNTDFQSVLGYHLKNTEKNNNKKAQKQNVMAEPCNEYRPRYMTKRGQKCQHK